MVEMMYQLHILINVQALDSIFKWLPKYYTKIMSLHVHKTTNNLFALLLYQVNSLITN